MMNKGVLNTADLVKYIRDSLNPYYPEKELNSMLFIMFEEVMGFSKTDIILMAENTLEKMDLIKFEQILDRLKKMEPLQYVLGSTHFYGVKIKTDSRALIPRPETEELVCWILEEPKGHVLRILDIGTGSGCIAIAIKKHRPNSQVLAMDISGPALELAQENADINKMNINFIQRDVLHLTDGLGIKELDTIVSNPPYIEYKEKKMMAKNVVDFEPEKALFVENSNALLFYKAIGNFALRNLAIGGLLFFETSEHYNGSVIELLEKMGFANVESRKDINGKPRMVRAVFK